MKTLIFLNVNESVLNVIWLESGDETLEMGLVSFTCWSSKSVRLFQKTSPECQSAGTGQRVGDCGRRKIHEKTLDSGEFL